MLRQHRNSALIERLLEYTSSQHISRQSAGQVAAQLAIEILRGDLEVAEQQRNCKDHIDQRVKERALGLIYQSEDYYNYERDVKIMCCVTRSSLKLSTPPKLVDRKKSLRKEQVENEKRYEQEMKRNFLLKVREWQAERAEILRRKRMKEQKQKSLDASSSEKRMKEEQEEHDFLHLFKKKSIEGKLREKEERRLKRSKQQLQESEIKQIPSPKYLDMEKKFLEEEGRREEEKVSSILKERARSMELNINEIIEHEKAYVRRIKERLKMKSQNSSVLESGSRVIESFNIHKKDPLKVKQIQEKMRRMREMEGKIRLLPLKISEEKRKEAEIINDKLKNRKKYNFLSQKALRDSQIYQEFKGLDLNTHIDKKEVGNHYFQEFKQQNVGKAKVHSEKVLPPQRPEYKDYIKEMRGKQKAVLNPDEFDSMAKKISSTIDRQAGRNYLREKSIEYEEKALEKIHELRLMGNYHDSVKKEGEIDKNYAKAIHAKLALVKIQ